MRTMLRSKVTLLFIVIAALVAVPAVAFAADTLLADADTLDATIQGSNNLGTKAPGETVNTSVDFYVQCNNGSGGTGAANLHFNDEDAVVLSPTAVAPPGGQISLTPTPISGPSSWPEDGQNCNSAGLTSGASRVKVGTSNVSLKAPNNVGTHTYTAAYQVTRPSGPNETLQSELSTTSVQVQFTLTVAQQSQTITFAQPDPKTYGDGDFDPGATASSGLPVSYSANGNCSIVDGKVHITGAGSCTVTASQAGNNNYLAAPDVERTFSIAKATPTISWNPQAITYGTALGANQLNASASGVGGGNLTGTFVYTPNAGTVLDAGQRTLSANFTPDNTNDYNSVNNAQATLTVNQAPLTVTADNKSKSYGPALRHHW
jgi:hypothetical protein